MKEQKTIKIIQEAKDKIIIELYCSIIEKCYKVSILSEELSGIAREPLGNLVEEQRVVITKEAQKLKKEINTMQDKIDFIEDLNF